MFQTYGPVKELSIVGRALMSGVKKCDDNAMVCDMTECAFSFGLISLIIILNQGFPMIQYYIFSSL